MTLYTIICYEGSAKVLKHNCQDREEALQVLRKTPRARMMTFTSELEMFKFLTDPLPIRENRHIVARVRPRYQENVDYDGRHDGCFVQAIEAGNLQKVWGMMFCIPALLINDINRPRAYNRHHENALHIAARCGHFHICAYILEAISTPLYITLYEGRETTMTNVLSAKLLDLYLNTPERYRYETPMHLATKYGWTGVVHVLISYPQCVLKPNKWGQFPQNLICNRASGEHCTDEVRSAIAGLLRVNYFVPLIRTESDLEPPYIGEPFSRQNLPDLSNASTDKLAPPRKITAFAGPMTLVQARHFRHQWQNSPRLLVLFTKKDGADAASQTGHDIRFLCTTSQKLYDKSNLSQAPGHIMRTFRKRNLVNGLERLGRYIAKGCGTQWKEYWHFLQVYCDLTEQSGLFLFETYLKLQAIFSPEQLIVIGGNIRNQENIHALHALKNVEINEQLYPFIGCWKRIMMLNTNPA